MTTPSPNGGNGRGPKGRFAPGNPGGPGNPHGRRVAQLRSLLLETVTDADFKAVIRALIKQARGGDVVAARLLLDRLLGRLPDLELEARLEALEGALAGEVGGEAAA